MKVKFRGLKRGIYASAAFALTAAIAFPSLIQDVSAAQVTSRSIEMSNSDPAATASSVSYQVGFTTNATGYTVKGVVVDFCDNSPISGDSCTAPTGFSVGTPTVATTGGSNTGLGSGWTAGSLNSGRTLTLTNATGQVLGASTPVVFTLSTATNPTAAAHTFYARIFTYTATAGATGYTAANPDAGAVETDYGGVALSTASNISITAKVQEQLSFCVYKTSCGTAPSLTLGDANGVLSSSNNYVNKQAQYDVQTNAQSGAALRIAGDTLKSGSNSITAIGSTNAASSAGTAQFGLCTYESSGTAISYTGFNTYNSNGGSPCSGTTTGASGDGGAHFGFNTTNTLSTYGDQFATVSAGSSSTGVLAFIANIPVSQPAGVYTTTLHLIATGTY